MKIAPRSIGKAAIAAGSAVLLLGAFGDTTSAAASKPCDVLACDVLGQRSPDRRPDLLDDQQHHPGRPGCAAGRALPDLPLGSLTTTLAPALAPVSGVVNTVCNTLDAAVP